MALFKMLPAFRKICSVGQMIYHKHNGSSLFVLTNKTSLIKGYCTQIQNHDEETERQAKEAQYEEDFISLADGNPEILKKLKILMLEVDVHSQHGGRAPDVWQMKKQNWEHLLSLPTRSARRKYLAFLWQIAKKKENAIVKKEIAKQSRDERKKNQLEVFNTDSLEDKNETEYGLHRNTMFLRIYDTTVNQMLNNRLIQAMRFGQPLVLDCSYEQHMTTRECVNTAKQLMLLFAENRAHSQPFDLHYCNANMQGLVMKQLHKHIATLNEPWFPLSIHQNSYLDHFPKERLVYLSPHCRNDLMEFNHDDVYIIGAMVDKANCEPLSLGKAKEYGIRVARFPLEKYLSWSSGSGKSLTLNQVCSILLDLRQTGNWNKALQHVPRRKVYHDEDEIKVRDKYTKKYIQRESGQMLQQNPYYRKTYNNEKFVLDFDEDNDKYRTKNNFNVKKWAGGKKYNLNVKEIINSNGDK